MNQDNLLLLKDKPDNSNQSRRVVQTFLNNEIKHLEQATCNDCGIACLRMALNYLFRKEAVSVQTEHQAHLNLLLEKLGVRDLSLWTIEIAHICALMRIKHTMHTVTLGVDEKYSSENFYAADVDFEAEKQRIREKFSNAEKSGIKIIQESVKFEFIKSEMFIKQAVCIVLVNANLLHGHNIDLNYEKISVLNDDIFNTDSIQTSINSCCRFNTFSYASVPSHQSMTVGETEKNNKNTSVSYSGHFLVLVGFDDIKQLIFYRNPASKRNFSFTSYTHFELARTSYGTDQDILFLYE